jgi:hypothetical protein
VFVVNFFFFKVFCEELFINLDIQIACMLKCVITGASTMSYIHKHCEYRVRVIGFNTTFNNISVISWHSVLLAEETEVPRENHRPATSC